MRIRFSSALVLLLICGFLILPTGRVTGMAHPVPRYIEWQELRTQYFVILFPSDYTDLANNLYDKYGIELDQEYVRFKQIFEDDLILPINIRVYPTEDDYIELNPQALDISFGEQHSHVGFREIALISEAIAADYDGWSNAIMNNLRYELGILFVEQITDLKAPPGVIAGVGGYVQDPALWEETRPWTGLSAFDPDRPKYTWQQVWESQESLTSPSYRMEALSTVAYLVDNYTWPVFLRFLVSLSSSTVYLQAVSNYYQQNSTSFQQNWAEYYPQFFSSRWQHNALYQFDLSPYEKLLAIGAYSEADQRLKEVIPFLEKTKQDEKIIDVNKLIDKAHLGQNAGSTALKARQMVIDGSYERAIELAKQALSQYAQLNDSRRKDELEIYQSRAEEVLRLRKQADTLSAESMLLSNPVDAVPDLIKINERLTALGDVKGKDKVDQSLEQITEIQARRRNDLYLGASLICIALLSVRIWLFFRPKPVEAIL